MSRPTVFSALAVSILLYACGDGTGPVPPGRSFRLDDDQQALVTLAAPHFLRQAPTAPLLETLQASAWIVRGKRQTIEVKYADPDDALRDTAIVLAFLRLDFHDSTLVARPDGSPIATGDSVLVTAFVDPQLLSVRLEPTGLTFNPLRPALLRIRYHNADADFNGDGVVDSTDEAIRTQRLGVFRQDEATGLWVQIEAEHDTFQRKFDAKLAHFSDYAIAW